MQDYEYIIRGGIGAGAVGSYVIWGLSLIQEVVEWN